jgi:hypothetical protein
MNYETYGTPWVGMCTTSDSGTRPAMRRCGGRDGASPFPAKSGEPGELTHARASVGKGETISILESIKEVAEGAVNGAVKFERLR